MTAYLTMASAILLTATMATAQNIKTPDDPMGSYDPTLSAKEALMANWELAASGIRAGAFVAEDVLAKATDDMPYADLRHLGDFTLTLMIKRYGSANWAIATQNTIHPIDGAVLLSLAKASGTTCAQACDAERAALLAALEAAAGEMNRAHEIAKQAVLDRKEVVDSVLMVEQLTAMADYLDGTEWHEGLNLSQVGRDGEELQARLVGAITLWRNLEPYVGLISPQIDDSINAASDHMLRDMRRFVRGGASLDVETPELTRLAASAKALAAELRRAAALFTS